jgi:hypothetical protein
MSKVIERVPTKIEETEEQICMCNKCGCGNTKDMTEMPCPHPDCDGYRHVQAITYRIRIPGYILVECDCGEEVVCQGFTSTCECGADYNGSGQRLAPREQWGEETGETYTDIVGPGDPYDEWV